MVNGVSNGKRKHVVVSLEKKLDALRRLDRGEPMRRVANELGVGGATVWDWRKKRKELEEWCSQRSMGNSSAIALRKTMRKGDFEKTSEALFEWFLEMREKGISVSGPTLQSKALELHKNFNEGDEFTASSGWLERWKKRYGIAGKKLNITLETFPADTREIADFASEVVEPMAEEQNLSMDENYGCDETVANSDTPPEESPLTIEENSSVEYSQMPVPPNVSGK